MPSPEKNGVPPNRLRHQQLAESASDKMWLSDAQGSTLMVNKQWCEFVGKALETQLGSNRFSAVHADDQRQVTESYEKAHRDQSLYRIRFRMRCQDGNYRWQVESGTPCFSDAGTFLGFFGCTHDIHDEREAQERILREADERNALMDSLIDCMPSGVIAVDMQGNLLVHNPAANRISGVDAADVPTDVTSWAKTYQLKFRDGRPMDANDVPMARALSGEVQDGLSFMIDRQDGSEPTLAECSARPIRDPAGQQIGALTVFTDITQRVTAEKARTDSEARLSSLIANSPGVVFRCDLETGWQMTFMSAAVENMTGHPPSYFVEEAHPWGSIILPEDAERIGEELKTMIEAGGVANVQYRIRHKDGNVVHVDGFAHIIDGRWYEGVLLDVTDKRLSEEREARSRARFAAQFHQTSLYQALLDCDGKLLEVNQTTLQGTGLENDQVAGQIFWEAPWWAPPANSRNAIQQGFEIAVAGSVFREQLDYMVQVDGTPVLRKVDITLSPIRNQDGKTIDVLAIGRDVTEEVQAQAELADSRARLEAIFEQATMFQALLDSDGLLISANDLAFRGTGFSRDQAMSKPFWEAPWWAAPANSSEKVKKGIALAASGSIHQDRLDFVAIMDGQTMLRRVEVTISPVRDQQGKLINVLAVGLDVTDAERAQRELEQSEMRFRLLTEASPQIIWTADSHGKVDFVNQTGMEYFGLAEEQLVGDQWLDAVHPDDREATIKYWMESVASGAPIEISYRCRRQDGEYRWMMVRGVAQKDNAGQARRWYGTLTDIEELRRAKAAAEQAAEAKGQFLANMSHEIRTPMNGVIGMTTLLQSTELDSSQRECVNTIRTSGEHLLALINDILDFSKIEAGQLELESYRFSLRRCMEDAIDLIAGNINNKKIELILDVPIGTPPQVKGDAGRLRQVLVNLLSNAIKFTDQGEVLAAVSVRSQPKKDGLWHFRFSVKDTGIGISKEQMDRLFKVFSQVDSSHARTYGGSGLGLAICKSLVEAMGGSISAESQPGHGSTFSFDLPLEKVDDDSVTNSLDLSGKRALVVDDNATNRRIVQLMLKSWGMEVELAVDGQQALDQLKTEKFSVALLDFHMPGLDGLTLAKKIRGNELTRSLPMILLGSIRLQGLEEMQTLFFARMLKPVRYSTLFDQLAVLFGERSSSEASPLAVEIEGLARTRPMKILVAEDNAVNQKVALRLLKKLGYEADMVGNGIEAVEAVKRQKYDLVLMDVQMPEMDGLEATRLIRRTMNQPPRIVAVTANAMAGDEQQCLDAGMVGYVSKPIDLRQLARELDRQQSAALGESSSSSQSDSSSTSEQAPTQLHGDYEPTMFLKLADLYDVDGAVELIETMQEGFPEQRTSMLNAIASQDSGVASRIAHSLKSTVRLVGAVELSEELETLEQALKNDGFAEVGPSVLPTIDRAGELFERLMEDVRKASESTK